MRKLYAPACQPGSSRAAGIAPARRHDRDGMERCCRARRSRAPSPPTISPRCCAWLGATDRSLASSSRISPSSILRSWDSSASHPTAPPLPNSSPPGGDQMSGCPADRELPPHRGILCRPDRGILIYQTAGQHHGPSITFTSGLSAVRVAPVSYRQNYGATLFTRKFTRKQQLASLHPSPSTAGLRYNRSELLGRVKIRSAFWLTFRPARAGCHSHSYAPESILNRCCTTWAGCRASLESPSAGAPQTRAATYCEPHRSFHGRHCRRYGPPPTPD